MAQPPEQPTSDTGEGRTDVARQQGAEVADETRQRAREVTETAKQDMGQVADEAKHHARELTHHAREELQQQARQQTENLGGALSTFGDRLHALAEGRPDDAGAVGDYADRLADQVEGVANRVDELGFDGIVHEAEDLARRRPGAFLGGALLAGFAVSRLSRGAKDAAEREGSSGRRSDPSSASSTTRGSDASTGAAAPLPPPAPSPTADEPQLVTDRSDPLSAGRARR